MYNRQVKKIFLLLLFVSNVAQASDVNLSWSNSLVYLPKKWLSTSIEKVNIDQQLPTVLYLHGCTGITQGNDVAWAKFISELGYAVILPDSMSRKNRYSNCDPAIKGPTGRFPFAYIYREEEINYAVEQIKTLKWVDQDKVFLMGHSEGGIATANTFNTFFKGYIISGWTCTHKFDPSLDGIKISKEKPTLAVAFIDDSWRKGSPREGKCINKSAGMKKFQQQDLQGSNHDTYYHPDARKSVKQFLKENTN